MSSQTCTSKADGLERVRYFSRQLITADDMLAEQQYFRQKLRRHNRFLHGWGVVCGLRVVAAPGPEKDKKITWPWRVKVEAGYALGPYGDEIYVAEPVCLDLASCLESTLDPCEPGEPPKPARPASGVLYVAIRYVECETRPLRVHPLGCACEDTLCEYSRIRDDFEISCLPEVPVTAPLDLICRLLAGQQLPECPPCPESPWVVLARVTLPDDTDSPLGAINNLVRRQLYTTSMLQEQLIDCCCEDRPQPQPTADMGITLEIDDRVPARTAFLLTVINHGPAVAHDVVVRNDCPSGSLLAGSLNISRGQWTVTQLPQLEAEIGNMQPDETVSLGFMMRSPEGMNTAVVQSPDDPNPANNTVSRTLPLG